MMASSRSEKSTEIHPRKILLDFCGDILSPDVPCRWIQLIHCQFQVGRGGDSDTGGEGEVQ